ncbi:MAG TPA: hypothetical protein VHM25_12675 [Polyangiaceae bacterium]|jgi:hypothetical protein|nr:hypothetical protein [Polyangiaceae bacterium]
MRQRLEKALSDARVEHVVETQAHALAQIELSSAQLLTSAANGLASPFGRAPLGGPG